MAGKIDVIFQVIFTADNEKALQEISIAEYQQRRYMRRLRVAKRMAKRFPLFAPEFMQQEFPGYTNDQFIRDITPTKPKRKRKSYRKSKSPLKRMGRWELVEKCLLLYHQTGDINFAAEAQTWRNKLYLPYELLFKIKGEFMLVTLSPETNYKMVQACTKFTADTLEDIKKQIKDYFKYSPECRYKFSTPVISDWKTKQVGK